MGGRRRLRIVIPGGTGQLGGILARHFHEQGHAVTALARHPQTADWPVVLWNAIDLGSWTDAIEQSDVIINLAGRSIHCRYNAANRRDIRNSRVLATGVLSSAIAGCAHPPPLWINVGSVAIYPHSLSHPWDESSALPGSAEAGTPARWQFSQDVAAACEEAFFAQPLPSTRRIALRTATVMSPDAGGGFDRLLRLVRLGLGGAAGSGQQYVSWIHEADFLRAVECFIERTDFKGAINVCSPCPLPNRRFMHCLRQAWCTSYVGFPLPAWLLSCASVALRTEPELLLKSNYVVPQRLLDSGFDFHFPDWRGAATNLVERWRQLRENQG